MAASGYRAWPPRLPEQPIFYPVTNERYARDINAWNVKAYGKGFVTRLSVRSEFAHQYAVHGVGAPHQTEWWIPAEDLADLNANIVDVVEIVAEASPP